MTNKRLFFTSILLAAVAVGGLTGWFIADGVELVGVGLVFFCGMVGSVALRGALRSPPTPSVDAAALPRRSAEPRPGRRRAPGPA